jgi:hypothetical protein
MVEASLRKILIWSRQIMTRWVYSEALSVGATLPVINKGKKRREHGL